MVGIYETTNLLMRFIKFEIQRCCQICVHITPFSHARSQIMPLTGTSMAFSGVDAMKV